MDSVPLKEVYEGFKGGDSQVSYETLKGKGLRYDIKMWIRNYLCLRTSVPKSHRVFSWWKLNTNR